MVEEKTEKVNEEDVSLDIGKVINFVKDHKTVFVYVVLALLLSMAFYSRTQNIPH